MNQVHGEGDCDQEFIAFHMQTILRKYKQKPHTDGNKIRPTCDIHILQYVVSSKVYASGNHMVKIH